MSAQDMPPEFSFQRVLFSKSLGNFAPRLGKICLRRPDGDEIELMTPALVTWTSRGVVPHLTRDHVAQTDAVKWTHVPFESFLERSPPIPTLQGGPNALHKLLGLQKSRHVLSMSLRDPFDGRELPPNGSKFINAHCIRGVRKVTPEQYHSFVLACQPDIVIALSDIPFSSPPFSQKRISKSLERSTAWLASLLQPLPHSDPESSTTTRPHPLNVFVHMSGDTSAAARSAFADMLREPLHGKDAEQVRPYKCLDDGVAGYTFDLVPLRASLLAAPPPEQRPASVPDSARTEDDPEHEPAPNRRTLDPRPFTQPNTPRVLPGFVSLMQASLAALPPAKPRAATAAASPHEVLRLLADVGIDLFDAAWAQKAADWGVALDFAFPVPGADGEREGGGHGATPPKVREDGTRDLGHNLYAPEYATDFSCLAACFRGGVESSDGVARPVCPCIACSPRAPAAPLVHSAVDVHARGPGEETQGTRSSYDPPVTRAYVHHLLHTHEMSAHALLAAHNLAVADAFFASVRRALARGGALPSDADDNAEFAYFEREAARFCAAYDGQLRVLAEGKRAWVAVDYARGKGRLAREKARQGEGALTTRLEKDAEPDEQSGPL